MARNAFVRHFMLEFEKLPICPLYGQPAPSATILLPKCRIEFSLDNNSYKLEARVEMRFQPSDQLLFVVAETTSALFNSIGNRLLEKGEIMLDLPDYGQSVKAFCISSSTTRGEILIRPKTSVITPTREAEDVARSIFHLLNFPKFFGPEDYTLHTGHPPRDGWRRCGRVILRAGGWTISIAATDKTDDCVKALKDNGGYIITHVGAIERDDHSIFSTKRLREVLRCLHFFLSFALGRWAGVALPVGVNRNNETIFEQWGIPLTSINHWNPACSWFDEHHAEFLSQIFPGFFAKWNDPMWKDAMSTVLYWYIGANDRHTGIGVDTGILLAQIALERLAWTHCVLDTNKVSKKDFHQGGLSAAMKLRVLLEDLSIPLEISNELPLLQSNFNDGPDAVTKIRNSLVHPDNTAEPSSELFVEAWKLSLWYLDVIMLRICEHTGKYANRCASRHVGEVESMP